MVIYDIPSIIRTLKVTGDCKPMAEEREKVTDSGAFLDQPMKT